MTDTEFTNNGLNIYKNHGFHALRKKARGHLNVGGWIVYWKTGGIW
jgi:hypothetical protein